MSTPNEVERIRRALGLAPLVASVRRPWREWLHPRDKFGRWIEKFSFVHVDGKLSGSVERMNRNGTVTVRIVKSKDGSSIGQRIDVTPDRIETVAVKAIIPDKDKLEVSPTPTKKFKGERPWTPTRPVLTGDISSLGNIDTWDKLREALKGKTIIAFDTETNGLNVDTNEHRVIELGAVKIKDGKIIDRFDTFVNPGYGIFDDDYTRVPPIITQITGITERDVKNAPRAGDAYKSFADWAGLGDDDVILAAHNANFDMAGLKNMARDAEVNVKTGPRPEDDEFGRYSIPDDVLVLDTLSLARAVLPKDNSPVQSRKLGDLAEYFDVKLDNWHRADADAEAAGLLIDKLFEHGVNNNSPAGQLKNLDLQNRTFDLDYDKYTSDLIVHRQREIYLHHLKRGGIKKGAAVTGGILRNKRKIEPLGKVVRIEPGFGYFVQNDKGDTRFYENDEVIEITPKLIQDVEDDNQRFLAFDPDKDLVKPGAPIIGIDGRPGTVVGVTMGPNDVWVYQIRNEDGSYRFIEAHNTKRA